MQETEKYEIIDDNSGEGYETYYDAAREMQTAYSGVPDLMVKADNGRWCIVRRKIEGD